MKRKLKLYFTAELYCIQSVNFFEIFDYCLCRLLAARNYSPFDEDGDPDGLQRSTVSFLNDETDSLAINGFSQLGFLLNNGLRVVGPCAVFPQTILQWNVCLVQHAALCAT